MSRRKLESYLLREGVDTRILTFEKNTITVDDAERQLGIRRERIIKSILFISGKGVPVLGIVTGDNKVSSRKLMEVCGAEVKIARLEVVKSVTGYEVGALPPVGHAKPIKTFIDPKVMTSNKVYGGGGTKNTLLEIDPRDIKRLTKAEVADISMDSE